MYVEPPLRTTLVMTLSLERLILEDDVDRLRSALSNHDIHNPYPFLDSYQNGYSPLTLAIHLSRLKCVQLLLSAGASALVKDEAKWSPLDEAVSLGNREIIKQVIRARKEEIRVWIETIGSSIIKQISQVIHLAPAAISELNLWKGGRRLLCSTVMEAAELDPFVVAHLPLGYFECNCLFIDTF